MAYLVERRSRHVCVRVGSKGRTPATAAKRRMRVIADTAVRWGTGDSEKGIDGLNWTRFGRKELFTLSNEGELKTKVEVREVSKFTDERG